MNTGQAEVARWASSLKYPNRGMEGLGRSSVGGGREFEVSAACLASVWMSRFPRSSNWEAGRMAVKGRPILSSASSCSLTSSCPANSSSLQTCTSPHPVRGDGEQQSNQGTLPSGALSVAGQRVGRVVEVGQRAVGVVWVRLLAAAAAAATALWPRLVPHAAHQAHVLYCWRFNQFSRPVLSWPAPTPDHVSIREPVLPTAD